MLRAEIEKRVFPFFSDILPKFGHLDLRRTRAALQEWHFKTGYSSILENATDGKRTTKFGNF